jgi:hypothetical protein
VNDEAEAVLAILAKRDAEQTITEADWQHLFSSEGYVRLKQRESTMKNSFGEDAFRTLYSLIIWLHSERRSPVRSQNGHRPI